MSRRALSLAACLLLLCSVALVWPARWGGQFSYVITNGISMEPRFHTGDLGVIRKADHYEIGEIAAYRNSQLHLTVMHRIVAKEGDRFTFKGDNNSFLDDYHPHQADIIGQLLVRIPRGGRVLRKAMSPGVLAFFGGLVVVAGGSARRRRPRRRRGDSSNGILGPLIEAATKHLPVSIVCPSQEAIITAAVVSTVTLALTALVWNVPARVPSQQKLKYGQQAVLNYEAQTSPNAIYPSGQLNMPDPVYLRLVPAVDIRIKYTNDLTDAKGTHEIFAVVRGGTGWKRTFTLAPESAFTGQHFDATTTLTIEGYQTLISQAEHAAGGPVGPYTVAITTKITMTGQLHNVPVEETFSPSLAFSLSSTRLVPTDANTDDAPSITQTKDGSISIPTTKARILAIPGPNVSVASARKVSPVLAALAMLVALALAALRRLHPDADTKAGRRLEPHGEPIPHNVRPKIVTTQAALIPADRTVMTVSSMAALNRVAERYERLIMHHVLPRPGPEGQPGEEHTFMVDDDTALYLYVTRTSTPTEVPEEAPPVPMTRRKMRSLIPSPRPPVVLHPEDDVVRHAVVVDSAMSKIRATEILPMHGQMPPWVPRDEVPKGPSHRHIAPPANVFDDVFPTILPWPLPNPSHAAPAPQSNLTDEIFGPQIPPAPVVPDELLDPRPPAPPAPEAWLAAEPSPPAPTDETFDPQLLPDLPPGDASGFLPPPATSTEEVFGPQLPPEPPPEP